MSGFGVDRSNVAWDIETTGFAEDDEISTSGFLYPDDHATVILNSDGAFVDWDKLGERLGERTGVDVDLICVRSEAALIEAMHEEVFEKFDKDYNRLVAYNADRWYYEGGFDCPFLRRRCLANDMEWVFQGVAFSDLFPIVQRRVNTTKRNGDGETEEQNDLVGAHAILCDAEDDPDPFEDSVMAVECYQEGRFYPLALHNLADIIKTKALADKLVDITPPNDWRDNKL